MKCDKDTHRELFANITLSGGNSMINGLDKRIEKEICNLEFKNVDVKVIADCGRKYGACIGGSILSSLSTFNNSVITRDEYNESGPGIIHTMMHQYSK